MQYETRMLRLLGRKWQLHPLELQNMELNTADAISSQQIPSLIAIFLTEDTYNISLKWGNIRLQNPQKQE